MKWRVGRGLTTSFCGRGVIPVEILSQKIRNPNAYVKYNWQHSHQHAAYHPYPTV